MAYLYRDNYPSNKVDIPHNSQECCHQHVAVNAVDNIDKGSLLQRGGRRAISVTFNTPAGKLTLIGSNCPADWVGRCVDCEGSRTAQIFSDCVVEFGRFARWTSHIGNMGAKLNIEKPVASVHQYRCWKK